MTSRDGGGRSDRGDHSDEGGYDIGRSADFDQVYNLDDPSPYYEPLAGADYRMPGELATWLEAEVARRVADGSVGGDQPLRVLDFACGYGFVGAVARHSLDVADVYRRYASRPWSAADGRSNWAADKAWFERRRLIAAGEQGLLSLAGLDIAEVAVAYADHVGLIDIGFGDRVVDDGVSPVLAEYLATVDVIIESGAIGGIYAECFGPLLVAARAGDRGPKPDPSFVYCPRPSVDLRSLDELWSDVGYTVELAGPPVRYRRPIGATERDELLVEIEAAGNDPETAFIDDYLAVQIRIARPA